MKQKRLYFLLSILVIACLFFTACSSSQPAATEEPEQVVVEEPEEENAAQEPATAEEPVEEPAETVTINIWDFGGDEFEWVETMAIPAFKEQYPNIEVVHLGVPEEDYSTKLETAITAGQVPDIALQSYTYRLWKAGHVMVLDEYLERDGFAVDDFYPIFQSWCMLEGEIYCMPVSVYIWAMVYNKTLFEEAGIPELTTDTVITYDDWLEFARAINKPAENLEDRVWGTTTFPPNWNAMNNYMSDPFVLGADGRECEGNAETDDWVNSWEAMVTAYNEDLTTDSSSALMGELSTRDLFKQNKLGMIYGKYSHVIDAQNAGIDVGVAGQPVVTPGWDGNVGSWADGYAIMSATEHPEEAWLFVKFLATEGAVMRAGGDCASCGNPPCYKPLAGDWAIGDPLKQDALILLDRVVPPPFTPDVWTSVDPYYEAWRLMTEEGADVREAVHEAAVECQEITDDLWAEWDLLGE